MSQTILVIEDQEQNLYLMKYMLEQRGYRVVLARDGEAGIAAARVENPDLILLDIQLPRISGYDVARALQSDLTTSTTPIVAVTSYAMPEDRKEAMAAGCTGYVEKPIEPDRFIHQMEEHLRKDPADPSDLPCGAEGGPG